MEYALLKFNDDIKIDIHGLGLVPLVSLYPNIWELYLKKLEYHAEHVTEIIKAINGKKNKEDEFYRKICEIKLKIDKAIIMEGLPLYIVAVKIKKVEEDYVVRWLGTTKELYINKKIFDSNQISEFEAKKYIKEENTWKNNVINVIQ